MSETTAEQAITTVDELPAELRAELVAKREAGTTLAELKKDYPHVAPDVVRAVLPPLPKGTEPKPAPRKPRATKPAQTPATGQRKGTASTAADKLAAGQARAARRPAKGGQAKAALEPDKASTTNDKELLKLAAKVVAARDQDGLSWLKIGDKFKLAPEAASAKAGASRARTLYRMVKGQDASTAALAKS